MKGQKGGEAIVVVEIGGYFKSRVGVAIKAG
jgi:hypothetical protein